MSTVITDQIEITRLGAPMHIVGTLPTVGSKAPQLKNLMQKDGTKFSGKELHEKFVVLNIYPSINSKICPLTVIEFNKRVAGMKDTVVLGISRDAPGALNEFCTAKEISNVIPLSAHRYDCPFGDDYGIRVIDGLAPPLTEMYRDQFGRALIVFDPKGTVIYSELVKEISHQPNYDACLETITMLQATSAVTKQPATADNPGTTNANPLAEALAKVVSEASATAAAAAKSTGSATSSTDKGAGAHSAPAVTFTVASKVNTSGAVAAAVPPTGFAANTDVAATKAEIVTVKSHIG